MFDSKQPTEISPETISFLTELDTIIGPDNASQHKECTRKLLEAGDAIFNNATELQASIKDGTFRQKISGTAYTIEQVDGKSQERPVIDLVQQGGTMLGIGLLGYTYVMEKAGVRFRSMAGTSAGAINTLLLSAIPEKVYQEKSSFFDDGRQALKSEFLAHLVANKNFSSFLDRPGTLGKIQKWLVKRITKIEKFTIVFIILIPVLLLGGSFFLYNTINGKLFTPENGVSIPAIRVYDFITGTLGIIAMLLLVLLLIFSLFKKTMGFNKGEAVYIWMLRILKTKFVNIYTTDELLERKKTESVLQGEKITNARLVFIAANLTHNRIVKFPENACDYWKDEFAGRVTPAAFVRASMSLPFIFHAFIPGDAHVITRNGSHAKDTVDMLARFIDGGMLSNFPIREFHVADPKYPTFGVLLSARKLNPPSNTPTEIEKFYSLPVFKFILSFISTFRNFYDNDFLLTHPELKKLVATVNTDRFNSLDFGMPFERKKELFEEGAHAAVNQLTSFDWDEYYKLRTGKTQLK